MRLLLFTLIFFAGFSVIAQPDSFPKPDSTQIIPILTHQPCTLPGDPVSPPNPGRLLLVTGGGGLAAAGSLLALQKVWYSQYSSGKFHLFNDGTEWKGMDKLGHITTSFTLARYGSDALGWCGVSNKKRIWLGGLTGFGYQAALEVMDGFSSGWGFSTTDVLANAGGYFLYTFQQAAWEECRIIPKFSFFRSPYAEFRPEILGASFGEQVLKDYNGQTYWLSVNLHSFMPEGSKFPSWINIAVGYGANGMTGGKENPVTYNSQGNITTFARYGQFYISPDIDLSRIPARNKFVRKTLSFFNFVKIPFPGIEVAQGKLYGQWVSH